MALTLPNDTLDVPWVEPKLVPVRVTGVPTAPDVGEIEPRVGAARTVKLTDPEVPVPVVTVTPGDPDAPEGTLHTTWVSDQDV